MEPLTSETEGVIKYRLRHTEAALDAGLDISAINAWRDILRRLGLIGQNPAKYGGLGYGNISRRLARPSGSFIVSGTQTGHLLHLKRNDYCIVLDADAQRNVLDSIGPCKPSSEALTHAVVYRQMPGAGCVIHVHSPEIWRYGDHLNLPYTAVDIGYGTPEMADSVVQLLATRHCRDKGIFTMRGHEDGVVAFGSTPRDTAQCLIACLADALAIAGGENPD